MIRQFLPEDAAACFELIRACVQQDLQIPLATREALLRSESPTSICERAALFYLAVYEDDRQILGMGALEMNEVRLLYVSPEHQRRGIGQALLEHLESMVPSDLFPNIFLYSTLTAEDFYRNRGYQSKGEHIFDLHGQPLQTIFMVKTLQPRSLAKA